jgi:protein-S-isoprenylcysteine O-methyltransferase
MVSSYVVPCTTATLFVARLVELQLRRSEHRGSIVCSASLPAMVVSGCAVLLVGFVEFFTRRPLFTGWIFGIGLALTLSGFVLRAWAARTLGDLWSTHIEIRANHRVVTSGPYRRIRHPIYVSLLVDVLGAMIMLRSLAAFVLFAVAYVPIVIWRLRVEERAMVEHLGTSYLAYMDEVPPILPFRRRKPR